MIYNMGIKISVIVSGYPKIMKYFSAARCKPHMERGMVKWSNDLKFSMGDL